MLHRLALGLLLSPPLIACGDTEQPPTPDAGSASDAGSSPEAGSSADAGPFDLWTPPPLDGWAPCGEVEGVECAVLSVPLDPFQDLGTVDLHVTRAVARIPERRLGVLFVNPGGPGGASQPMVEQLASSDFFRDITDRFDLIGVDPRGIGSSAPLDCLEPERIDRFYAADTLDALDAVLPELIESCLDARDPAFLARMSTAYAVRDLEWVRAALGEEKINFLGVSYGAKLAASYASLFPARVRAFVLDSPLGPEGDYRRVSEERAAAQEAALQAFFEHCGRATNPGQCRFHRGQGARAVEVAFDALLERARLGIVGPDARPVYRGELQAATLVVLAAGQYPLLAQILAALEQSVTEQVLSFADLGRFRDPDGSYDPLLEQNTAVTCGDYFGPGLPTAEELRARLAVIEATSPRLGVPGRAYLACGGWPAPALPPVTVGARDAPPMLVIGGETDPLTPMSWATGLRQRLHPNSYLFRSDHSGHVAYDKSIRAINRVRDFLLEPDREPTAYSCLRTDLPHAQEASAFSIELEPLFYPALTESSSVTLEVIRRADDVVLTSTSFLARPNTPRSWTTELPTGGEPLDVYYRARAPGRRVGTVVPPRPLVGAARGYDHAQLFMLTEAELARLFSGVTHDPETGFVLTYFRDCDGTLSAGSLAAPPAGLVHHGRERDGRCYAAPDASLSDPACGYAAVLNVPPGTYRAQFTAPGGTVIPGPEYEVLPGSYSVVTVAP